MFRVRLPILLVVTIIDYSYPATNRLQSNNEYSLSIHVNEKLPPHLLFTFQQDKVVRLVRYGKGFLLTCLCALLSFNCKLCGELLVPSCRKPNKNCFFETNSFLGENEVCAETVI